MAKYIHDFDCVASVTNEIENFEDIDPEVLRQAMLKRINELQPDELREAFGHVDTNEDLA